jgi:hypothetical protein
MKDSDDASRTTMMDLNRTREEDEVRGGIS